MTLCHNVSLPVSTKVIRCLVVFNKFKAQIFRNNIQVECILALVCVNFNELAVHVGTQIHRYVLTLLCAPMTILV